MTRHVVRVRMPIVKEYDVVFDDGTPVFVGAVIKRQASASGPHAGEIIDTHRTIWDVRGSGSLFGVRDIVHEAATQLVAGSGIASTKIPTQLDKPHEEKIVGRPLDWQMKAIHRKRRIKAAGYARTAEIVEVS